jgi:predicted kinase
VEPWEPESHEQNSAVMGIVARAAAGYADARYTTIVDGIISPHWFLEPLRDAFRDEGHQVAYAVLRTPLEVCLSRAAAREGADLADRTVIEQLWADFADLGPLERHAIETEDMSAEQVAAELAGRLRRGELACEPDA